MKAVGACLMLISQLVVDLKKPKLKKLPDPSKDFVGSCSIFTPVKWLGFLLVPLSSVV